MRFYAWRALYGSPKGQLQVDNWWISKQEPKTDIYYSFCANKGDDIKYIRMYLKRLDEEHNESTIRDKAPASVKLMMAARALASATKRQREKPLRATGFNWDCIR